MAILWMDGFDQYGGAGAAVLGEDVWEFSTPSRTDIVETFPHTGMQCLRLEGFTNTTASRSFPERSVVGAGAFYRFSDMPLDSTDLSLMALQNAAGQYRVSLTVDLDLRLSIRAGDRTGTIVDTTVNVVLSLDTYIHVEMRVTTAGGYEVRVNESTVLSGTGASWGAAGDFAAWAVVTADNSDFVRIDDVFVWDTTGGQNDDFLGMCRVQKLDLANDTAQADWDTVPAETDGFEILNNVPPDEENEYIEAGDEGSDVVSQFGLGALQEDATNVLCVQTYTFARYTGEGIPDITVGLESGGQLEETDPVALTPGYAYSTALFPEDPDTSSPWTPSSIEAALVQLTRLTESS